MQHPGLIHVNTENSSPDFWIAKAIEQKADFATLERLLALRAELRLEQAAEAFRRAMSLFQAECPIIPKTVPVKNRDGTVRYWYAPAEVIAETIAPLLGKHQLSYSFDMKMTQQTDGTTLMTAICQVSHAAGYTKTSEFSVPVTSGGYMTAPQEYASAASFAKRHALQNAFGIITGEEDDDARSVRTAPTEHQKQVQRQEAQAKKLPEGTVADLAASMEAAVTLRDLEEAYKHAYVTAAKAGDKEALHKFVKIKDKLKSGLHRIEEARQSDETV